MRASVGEGAASCAVPHRSASAASCACVSRQIGECGFIGCARHGQIRDGGAPRASVRSQGAASWADCSSPFAGPRQTCRGSLGEPPIRHLRSPRLPAAAPLGAHLALFFQLLLRLGRSVGYLRVRWASATSNCCRDFGSSRVARRASSLAWSRRKRLACLRFRSLPDPPPRRVGAACPRRSSARAAAKDAWAGPLSAEARAVAISLAAALMVWHASPPRGRPSSVATPRGQSIRRRLADRSASTSRGRKAARGRGACGRL